MTTESLPQFTFNSHPFDMSPAGIGTLRRSIEVVDDRQELHRRMTRDGYLFLPGYLDREEVLAARKSALQRLAAAGLFDEDAVLEEARQRLGGRWLTADYRMGDLLVFTMHTMHAAHDNQTNRLRISTDSRYQLASEPIDQRWIGDPPPGTDIRQKRGMIC
jgi:hypothetical protein